MENLTEKLNKVDQLKNKLNDLRPLSDGIQKRIKIYFDEAIIKNSVLGKCSNLNDQNILRIAYQEVLDYTDELSKKNTNELYMVDITKIHYLFFRSIYPKYAGKYRDSEAWVSLENMEKEKVCPFQLIPDEMDKYFNWLISQKNEHPLIIAADAHNRFVKIHPFIDANGRTGREIMNLILLKNGYARIIIKAFRIRQKYEQTIKSWQNGEKDEFYNLIADCEEESLKMYLEEII
jgi:Fic family protein